MSIRWLAVICLIHLAGGVSGCRAQTEGVTVPPDQPLPEPATWLPYWDGWPNPLPPKLREAHKVAADYLQRPLRDIYFGGVMKRRWGDFYIFDRHERYRLCEVQMPAIVVSSGEVVPPWKPGETEGITYPLSHADAARVAEAFVVDRLGLDVAELERRSGVDQRGDGDPPATWSICWCWKEAGVRLPGTVNVTVAAVSGEVTEFVNIQVPVRVGLKPSLSRERAVQKALKYLDEQWVSEKPDRLEERTKVIETFLMVDYFPRSLRGERVRGARQRLVWTVVLEPPLPAEWANWGPGQVWYYIDAHNGLLRGSDNLPMRPPTEVEGEHPEAEEGRPEQQHQQEG